MTKPAIWFPTVKTNSGSDKFTEQLVDSLNNKGIRAEITWLPHHAEYLPWTVQIPATPEWANIAHVNTWLHSRFLPKNLPVIATLHHSVHDPNLRQYKGLLRTFYHQLWIAPNERRVMKRATYITAVSQSVADMAKKTLCDVPIQVIRNGIDINSFRPKKRVFQINKNKPFRLLYIGQWKKLKGVDLLPLIMHKIGDEFELYYTGGEIAEKDKSTMPYNMHDLGRLNRQEVIHAMQNADALLFPSRSEGFGLVVAEAISCGLPIITTNISPLSEIVTHKKTGLLCNLDDIQDFTNSIHKIRNHYEQFYSECLNTRDQFSHHLSIKDYCNIYQQIIS